MREEHPEQTDAGLRARHVGWEAMRPVDVRERVVTDTPAGVGVFGGRATNANSGSRSGGNGHGTVSDAIAGILSPDALTPAARRTRRGA